MKCAYMRNLLYINAIYKMNRCLWITLSICGKLLIKKIAKKKYSNFYFFIKKSIHLFLIKFKNLSQKVYAILNNSYVILPILKLL